MLFLSCGWHLVFEEALLYDATRVMTLRERLK